MYWNLLGTNKSHLLLFNVSTVGDCVHQNDDKYYSKTVVVQNYFCFNFLVVRYIQETVFTYLLPQNLAELKIHIHSVCKSADMQMLFTVWKNIDNYFDVFKITTGTHTEIW